MNLRQLSHSEIVKGLCIIGDRDFQFARRYLEGAGFDLRRDGEKARAWCVTQAEVGFVEAQFVLAKLYVVGLYGNEDKQEALRWCQKAAEGGFLPAILLLSSFHESGWGGLEPNPQRGLELLRAVAEKDYPPAMSSLAVLYLEGIHVKKDRATGLRFLRQAAELGDAYAQCVLGYELAHGEDAVSVAEGVKWIKAAADQGDASAHAHLGHFYWDGSHGFPEDKAKSRHHRDLAAKLEEESYAGLI